MNDLSQGHLETQALGPGPGCPKVAANAATGHMASSFPLGHECKPGKKSTRSSIFLAYQTFASRYPHTKYGVLAILKNLLKIPPAVTIQVVCQREGESRRLGSLRSDAGRYF